MSSPIVTHLFAEDRAHEELLRPLLQRLGQQFQKQVQVQVRSARGGHGRALAELCLYQQAVLQGVGGQALPDLLVVAIDANCSKYTQARNAILGALEEQFRDRAVCACPDPHVERWYLADLKAFHAVVGITPQVGKQKCKRDVYKAILARAVTEAGHPPTLGGIEFARDLAEAMDFFRAGKADGSLKHFLDEVTARLQVLGGASSTGP